MQCRIWRESGSKHLLRYLAKTLYLRLHFSKAALSSHAYINAYWENDSQDRKSYTGYGFFYAGSVFAWESKKRGFVALSSTEAEYIARSPAFKKATYLHRLMNEVNCHNPVEAVT